MEKVIYRQIEKRDYTAVEEIINRSFGLFRYVSNREILDYFKKQYLYSCLAEATYAYVAVQNQKVIGVIMGNAKSEYHITSHLKYILKAFYFGTKMNRIKKSEARGIEDYKNVHHIYHSFSKEHSGEFDGVLTLFAVEEAARGLGVGKTLLNGLMDYLVRQDVKRIYLYTDSTCNYKFYEHQGFERLEEQNIELMRDESLFQMEIYLYEYILVEKVRIDC